MNPAIISRVFTVLYFINSGVTLTFLCLFFFNSVFLTTPVLGLFWFQDTLLNVFIVLMGVYNLKPTGLFSVMFVFYYISSYFDFATGYELRNCLIVHIMKLQRILVCLCTCDIVKTFRFRLSKTLITKSKICFVFMSNELKRADYTASLFYSVKIV